MDFRWTLINLGISRADEYSLRKGNLMHASLGGLGDNSSTLDKLYRLIAMICVRYIVVFEAKQYRPPESIDQNKSWPFKDCKSYFLLVWKIHRRPDIIAGEDVKHGFLFLVLSILSTYTLTNSFFSAE